jgi:hypothetical protein
MSLHLYFVQNGRKRNRRKERIFKRFQFFSYLMKHRIQTLAGQFAKVTSAIAFILTYTWASKDDKTEFYLGL